MSQQLPDEHYEAVADAVRDALGDPEWSYRPGRYVAERWGVPRTTAHGWIKRCRQKGLLPDGPLPRGVCRRRCSVCCPPPDPDDVERMAERHARGAEQVMGPFMEPVRRLLGPGDGP